MTADWIFFPIRKIQPSVGRNFRRNISDSPSVFPPGGILPGCVRLLFQLKKLYRKYIHNHHALISIFCKFILSTINAINGFLASLSRMEGSVGMRNEEKSDNAVNYYFHFILSKKILWI